eukprot:2816627-Pleurochrysis_carterae.AAC.1
MCLLVGGRDAEDGGDEDEERVVDGLAFLCGARASRALDGAAVGVGGREEDRHRREQRQAVDRARREEVEARDVAHQREEEHEHQARQLRGTQANRWGGRGSGEVW